jgi:transposase
MADATFYLVRSGEAWRLLPHDLPPGQMVYMPERVNELDRKGLEPAASRRPFRAGG